MIQNFFTIVQQDIANVYKSCTRGVRTSDEEVKVGLSAARILAGLGIVFGGMLIAKGWKHDSVRLILTGVATGVLCRDGFVLACNATLNMSSLGSAILQGQTFFQNIGGALWGTGTNRQPLTNGTICRLFWDKIVSLGR